MPDWLGQNQDWLQMLGVYSGLLSLGSLGIAALLLPVIVVQLPADYFIREHRDPVRRHRPHPLVLGSVVLIKNLLGAAFLVAGTLMLFLPGQGLLTLLIGLILTNYPGKYWMEQRIIRRPAIARTLNAIRRRADKPAFLIPGKS